MSFDQAAVAKAVTDALATETAIPSDHRGAFVTVVTQDGVRAVIAHRFSDDPNGWLISAYVEKDWKKDGLEEGVTLQKSW